jgi:hypothetical protein
MVTTAAYSACTRPSSSGADAAAIERAALTTLFLEREHARTMTLLEAAREAAPVLGDVPLTSDTLAVPNPRLLALPVPVTVVTRGAIDSVFRANPDGWAAWYARYPGSAGLIELTAPVVGIDANGRLTATLVVARSCGEHCRSAWRVAVRRDGRGVWRTEGVEVVVLPRK